METFEVLHRSGSRYDATVLSVYTDFVENNEDINDAMGELYNDLNDDISAGFGDASAIVTGENSMMYVIMNSMTESQLLSTGICIILAAIVLIIAYRKPLLGIITLIPVSFSTIWIIGTMYFLGYSLNIMTIMITSLTIGLGITYAIHAVERFRLMADKTGNVVEAVSETIGHTGGALMIAAITTIAGFGMLILTPVPVEQQFGIITALTIFYAFITSIFVLPPVLMFWGRWKKRTKGYIISPGKPKN
jgi:predicted RND superfamily exporter protein